MSEVSFELEDVHGEVHRYVVDLFSVDTNANMQIMFIGPVMQSIGRIIGALGPALEGKTIDQVLNGGWPEFAAILRGVDWVKAPDAINILSDVIKANGGSELVAQILCQTKRYYHVPEIASAPTISDKQPEQPHLDLSKPADRTLAYDGNMGEYWKAAFMVLMVNFTQLGRSGLTSLNDALGLLTLGTLKRSEKTEETAKPKSDTNSDATTLRL
jgi:hypothetical protein